MGKIRALTAWVLPAVAVLLLGGCVMTAEKAFLASSDQVKGPDLAPVYRASKKNEVYRLRRVEGAANTFIFTAPDDSRMKLVFEPLKTSGRYLIQVENEGWPEVLLGLCALRREAIDLYAINPQAAASLASGKYGFHFNQNGQIDKMPEMAKVKRFFEAVMDDPEYAMKAETITAQPDQDGKK